MESRDVTTPHSGTICHPQARTCYMINLHTKCELSGFTLYEDMKGNAKCRNWGGLGATEHLRSPAMSPFDKAHRTSYWTLIQPMHLFCTAPISTFFVDFHIFVVDKDYKFCVQVDHSKSQLTDEKLFL